MAETRQYCACCGNRYESGGGCDCQRNLKRIGDLESWIRAANQFAWAHERRCPRHDGDNPCNCGLDDFLSKPRPVIESFQQRIAELTVDLAHSQRVASGATQLADGLERELHQSEQLITVLRAALAEERARLQWLSAVSSIEHPQLRELHRWASFNGGLRAAIDAAKEKS